jgi:uroporphyrinogen-III synthase
MVTVQRHGGPNPALLAALHARGAEVQELSAYRWSLPIDTAPLTTLLDGLQREEVDVLVVTSASQIENVLTFAETAGRRAECLHALARVKVLSIGPKLGPLMSLLEAHL